jgi:hypothetical protein
MLNTRHRIAPRVLLMEARGRLTELPLDKLEHDSFVSANKLAGNERKLKRYVEDAVRLEIDLLAEAM